MYSEIRLHRIHKVSYLSTAVKEMGGSNQTRESFIPSKHSRVCSKHFLQLDYYPGGSRELLKTSVSSVFNFPERLQKNESPRRPLVRKRKEDDSSESSFSKQSATTTKMKVERYRQQGRK